MDSFLKCPICHLEVRPSDYFCFNCGKNLKPKPPSTSFEQQIIVYLESIFLPPYGIVLGMRYMKQKENKSMIIGLIAVILTVASILIFTKLTLDLINNINDQVNSQMQQFGGF